ncbi:MAG TPA: DUF6511 domain-containing protein [Caulobacteraceae bacterium]|jgi:hypothetical protein|nr:DUF6511 domain-containing protein [Caulobacteraceae bacterium]
MPPENAKQVVFTIDREACLAGGKAAGAYLEKLGKFDLGALNEVEWGDFLQVVVAGAVTAAMANPALDEIPF